MATTLTNLSMAGIEMAIQAALKNALVPINAFSLGISTEGMRKDDVKRVPVLTDPTAQSKTLGTATTENGAVTGKDVKLDTPKEAAFKMKEGEVSASEAQSFAEGLAAGAVYSLAKDILDAAFNLVTAANYATKVTSAAADFGMDDLGLLFAAAETKKLGRVRSLILNSSYVAQLLANSQLGITLATIGSDALKTAVLPPLLGMQSYMYSGLPTNNENLGGMVIDKTSIAVAVSPIEQLVAEGEADCLFNKRVSDPDSGLTVNYKMVGNADGGYIKGIVSVMYGVAKVQDAIVRLVSA